MRRRRSFEQYPRPLGLRERRHLVRANLLAGNEPTFSPRESELNFAVKGGDDSSHSLSNSPKLYGFLDWQSSRESAICFLHAVVHA